MQRRAFWQNRHHHGMLACGGPIAAPAAGARFLLDGRGGGQGEVGGQKRRASGGIILSGRGQVVLLRVLAGLGVHGGYGWA